jgi:hypothetical protein
MPRTAAIIVSSYGIPRKNNMPTVSISMKWAVQKWSLSL